MTIGFGHGIAVTPLHLATGYATLFNGGIYHPATLLKVGPQPPAPPGRRVFSEDTSYKMRSLLRLVVTKGTGKKADAPGYRVGGKTGTAQKLINGHYSQPRQHHELRGCVPDGRPALCDRHDARRPKATKDTYGFTYGRLERRAGCEHARSAASRRCSACTRHEPRAEHVARCCPSFTKTRRTKAR